jgi:hypothetical protein
MDIKFVKQTNILEEPIYQNFYHTTIDGNIVVDSGSHNYEKALEKYNLIVTNAGIIKITEILETNTLD